MIGDDAFALFKRLRCAGAAKKKWRARIAAWCISATSGPPGRSGAVPAAIPPVCHAYIQCV